MASKLKKNLFYNIAYQLLNVALPLVTVPYIARSLGVESNGVYSYTYSIANYFMIFAMLGISNYGSRHIAKSRENTEKLKSDFSSIYLIQIILSLFCILSYAIYCMFIASYPATSWIEILFILSVLLDVSWLYFGLEEFRTTVLRNTIIKIISVILIFVFVKNSTDLNLYTAIMAGSTLISQFVLWVGIPKYTSFSIKHIDSKKLGTHFKGILILFIPVISYSIYKIMDKIMLGMLYSVDEVAFYEYSERIIGIPIGIITAIGTVMLPKISNLIGKSDNSVAKGYLYSSLQFICFLTIPCCFGLIATSPSITQILLGEAYARTGVITQFLAVTIPCIAWANVIRTQWLIPNEKDNIYINTTLIGALINFFINMLLIPSLGGIGASIGTIIAEFLIMFSQSFLSRKAVSLKRSIKRTVFYALTSIIMFITVYLIGVYIENTYIKLTIQIFVGVTIYCILNIKYIRELIEPILTKANRSIKS